MRSKKVIRRDTIEKLEQVVRVVKTLPKDKKFDLDQWMTCGTVGCGIGWSASDPWFKRRGFVLMNGVPALLYNPKGFEVRCTGSRAIEYFFGLTDDESTYLFFSDSYKRGNKQDFLSRLEAFIRLLKKGKDFGAPVHDDLVRWL